MHPKNIDKWTNATQLSVQNINELNIKKIHSAPKQPQLVNMANQSKMDIMHDMLNQVLSVMDPYEEQQSEGTFSEVYMDNFTGEIKGMNRILTVKNIQMTDQEIDDFYKEKGDKNDN